MAKEKQQKSVIRNRIVGHGEERLDGIVFNPKNWRIHPTAQQDALSGVLNDVGWVQNVIINKRTGNLIDGHLRVSLADKAGDKTIPVTYVDLSEEEEAEVLATLDPLSAMAAADKTQLDALLKEINTNNEAVKQMLTQLAARENILQSIDYQHEWQGMPEFNDGKQIIKTLFVHFETQDAVASFSALVGQEISEKTKYIWYPEHKRADLGAKRWTADEQKTDEQP